MGGYDDIEDLPVASPAHRAVTVTLLALLLVIVVGVIGVFAYAVSPWGDPTAGTMPPNGSGRELVSRLVPVLDDDAAIAELVPASTPSERAQLRAECGAVAGRDVPVTVFDDVTPSPFRVIVGGGLGADASPGCSIGFRWVKGEGWHASAITY